MLDGTFPLVQRLVGIVRCVRGGVAQGRGRTEVICFVDSGKDAPGDPDEGDVGELKGGKGRSRS